MHNRAMRRFFKLTTSLFFFLLAAGTLTAQTREIRAGQLVLDDGDGNKVTIQTSDPTSTGTLTLPDPGTDAEFVLTEATGAQTINTNVNIDGNLNVENKVRIYGSLQLFDNDEEEPNKVTIKAPGNISSNFSLTLPKNDGDDGQVLITNGSGKLTWGYLEDIGEEEEEPLNVLSPDPVDDRIATLEALVISLTEKIEALEEKVEATATATEAAVVELSVD